MREIKFRAWVKRLNSNGEMIYKDFAITSGGDFCYERGGSLYEKESISRYDEVIPLQFTGLKDKNSKEIYEGDIVEDKSVGRIMEVSWCTRHMGFELLEPTDKNGGKIWEYESLSECEILGNIYENPELLDNEK